MNLRHSAKRRHFKALTNTSNRSIYRKNLIKEDDPYWDECVAFYPQYNWGTNAPNKRLQKWEQRKFRTWKYNRTTQWK